MQIKASAAFMASLATVAMAVPAFSATVLLSDDFAGAANASPSAALWAPFTYSGAGKNVLDGNGNIVCDVNTTAYGNYCGVVSQSSTFDAFSSPLTIALDGVAVGDGTTASSSSNNGWLLYGRSNNSSLQNTTPFQRREYHADPASMAFGVMTQISRNNAGAYSLVTQEYSDNASGGRAFNHSTPLTGAPTSLSMKIDGANRTMTITIAGATFTSTGQTTLTEALSADFTAANLSVSNVLTSRIAFGTSNGNTTSVDSTFTISSISVTSVPEPASLGMVAGAGLVALRRRRVR